MTGALNTPVLVADWLLAVRASLVRPEGHMEAAVLPHRGPAVRKTLTSAEVKHMKRHMVLLHNPEMAAVGQVILRRGSRNTVSLSPRYKS